MKKQLNKKTTSNTWSSNPQIINTYINQYKIKKSSPKIDGIDLLDQINNVLVEHDTACFNSDLMKKLNSQIKSDIRKKDCSVGIKFINIHDVLVWHPNGDLNFTWGPEMEMVYNMYINYFVKSKNRIYFQTNEGHCFILNKSDVELKYNL
tara:strand:+ start:569 stop:1018 length:450 start_codon:yes stop_codon:yes gene_type:complete